MRECCKRHLKEDPNISPEKREALEALVRMFTAEAPQLRPLYLYDQFVKTLGRFSFTPRLPNGDFRVRNPHRHREWEYEDEANDDLSNISLNDDLPNVSQSTPLSTPEKESLNENIKAYRHCVNNGAQSENDMKRNSFPRKVRDPEDSPSDETARHYEATASMLVENVAVTTLLLQSRDDSIVSYDHVDWDKFHKNKNIIMLETRRGGHVGTLQRKTTI